MEKYIVKLTLEERNNLIKLTRTRKHAASKILHASILLEAAEGEYADSGDKKIDQMVVALFYTQLR
jgi:hypothetical protein